MKQIIANWKANKSPEEASAWMKTFIETYKSQPNLSVVICPPFPLLEVMKWEARELKNVSLGSQDVSKFAGGAYTGEVSAKTLAPLVEYAIIGHSERRNAMNETEETIQSKLTNAKAAGIKPILCVRDEHDMLYEEASFVAYEPVNAISTGPVGKNASLEDIIAMKKRLTLKEETKFIYGGSVTDTSIGEYLKSDEIDGFLVGGASLDPARFCALLAKI